jgi:ribulose-5-phosphate 4-epimerase/fuculose-1-phosphate aldolase
MKADESDLREEICRWGRSMFERGLSPGSSGNLTARVSDGFLATPTGSCLGFLVPERLSKLDADGRHVSGDPPTKEAPLHLAVYRARPDAGGVVHLHSTYATALSCLAHVNQDDALAPLTPYAIMQLGPVPVVPYAAPGSDELAELVARSAVRASAMLLSNHGPVVSARTFRAAVFAAEELEEAAKLSFLTEGRDVHLIPPEEIAALRARYAP